MSNEIRSAFLDALTAEVKNRRDHCPILLSVQVLSTVVALDLSQKDIDEAFGRANRPPPSLAP